jgi:hybrid cluster-associated redox disulfide protein
MVIRMMPKAANLQKIRDGRRTYAITPSVPGGFIKPELIRGYADVAEKYGATLKITSAQRIMIIGLKAEDVEAVWQELGLNPAMSYANCVRSIKMCPGSAFCKRGLLDSIKIGMELDKRYHKQEMPSRMKMGVAGCPNSCAEVYIKDIGVMATEAGWTVLAGGSCGRKPRLADKIAEGLSDEEALALVDILVEYYKKYADIERMGEFIERIGLDKFRQDVLKELGAKLAESTAAPAMAAELPAALSSAAIKEAALRVEIMAAAVPGRITKESIIGDIIRDNPNTIAVFRSHGMGCLGCPSASGENLEKAAGIHGIDVDSLLSDLNKV